MLKVSDPLPPFSATAVLVILDVLLNLEYQSHQVHVQDLAYTMVASHMRKAYTIPVTRSHMYTGYPSEPILAIAALDLIWEAILAKEEIRYPCSGNPILDMLVAVENLSPGLSTRVNMGKT